MRFLDPQGREDARPDFGQARRLRSGSGWSRLEIRAEKAAPARLGARGAGAATIIRPFARKLVPGFLEDGTSGCCQSNAETANEKLREENDKLGTENAKLRDYANNITDFIRELAAWTASQSPKLRSASPGLHRRARVVGRDRLSR